MKVHNGGLKKGEELVPGEGLEEVPGTGKLKDHSKMQELSLCTNGERGKGRGQVGHNYFQSAGGGRTKGGPS